MAVSIPRPWLAAGAGRRVALVSGAGLPAAGGGAHAQLKHLHVCLGQFGPRGRFQECLAHRLCWGSSLHGQNIPPALRPALAAREEERPAAGCPGSWGVSTSRGPCTALQTWSLRSSAPPPPLSPGLLAAQEKADLARTWGDPAPLSASTLPLRQPCPSPPRNTGQSPLSSSLLPLSLVPSSCCFTSFSSSAVLEPFPTGLLYTLENSRGAQRDFAYYGGN